MRYRLQRHDGTDCSATMVPITVLRMVPIQRYRQIWGYRYYEVYTEENTYILISKRCIRNKNQIKKFVEVTDYMGLIINEK